MTLISRSDVVQEALRIRNERNALKKVEEGKVSCKDFTEKESDEVLENLRGLEEDRERMKANISIDHQKFLAGDFQDLWTGTLGGQNGVHLKVNGKLFKGPRMHKVVRGKVQIHNFKDDEPDVPNDKEDNSFVIIPLTPVNMNAFMNLRKRYQYFRINRIAVNFVSNSATNLSPILCRYIPPTIRARQVPANFYTKVAESKGTQEGYMSIHTPPCLMKQIEKRTLLDNEVAYSLQDVIPQLQTGRLCTDYNEDKWYLDFGGLLFETKNTGVEQNVIMRMHYKIDFYTGYDYESAIGEGDGETFPFDPFDGAGEKPEDSEDEENDGNGNNDSTDDSTGNSKPTTQTRIDKRVPRNLLTRKAK